MTHDQHAERTLHQYGLRADDIHRWIDGLFDFDGYQRALRGVGPPGFDPYGHRKHRHCREALEEAVFLFGDKYSESTIRLVFETHVRDDYMGYFPCRADFEQEWFVRRYHR